MNLEIANYIIKTAMDNGAPLQLSRLISCQSAFETENWTSKNYLHDNNGFGYKHVDGAYLQLPTPGIHSTETDCYAAYETFEKSINEICKWIGRRQKESKFPIDLTTIQTPQQYAFLLKDCGYYGGTKEAYASGIENYLNKLTAIA